MGDRLGIATTGAPVRSVDDVVPVVLHFCVCPVSMATLVHIGDVLFTRPTDRWCSPRYLREYLWWSLVRLDSRVRRSMERTNGQGRRSARRRLIVHVETGRGRVRFVWWSVRVVIKGYERQKRFIDPCNGGASKTLKMEPRRYIKSSFFPPAHKEAYRKSVLFFDRCRF